MKRWLTFVFVLALAVALGGAVSRVPEALVAVEAFKVTEVRLRGARFLEHENVLESLDLSSGASVWDDTKVLEARLQEHPLVESVKIHRRFPDALLVQFGERIGRHFTAKEKEIYICVGLGDVHAQVVRIALENGQPRGSGVRCCLPEIAPYW